MKPKSKQQDQWCDVYPAYQKFILKHMSAMWVDSNYLLSRVRGEGIFINKVNFFCWKDILLSLAAIFRGSIIICLMFLNNFVNLFGLWHRSGHHLTLINRWWSFLLHNRHDHDYLIVDVFHIITTQFVILIFLYLKLIMVVKMVMVMAYLWIYWVLSTWSSTCCESLVVVRVVTCKHSIYKEDQTIACKESEVR